MIYWGVKYEEFFEAFIHYGAVVDLRLLGGRRIGDEQETLQPLLIEEF
jgi:hypothetical protein